MLFLILGIAIILWIGSIACWVMTLIKMFKHESTGLAVLGIICGIWAFIWGWQNAKKYDHLQIMKIWTGLIVASVVVNVISSAMSAAG